MVFSVLLSVKQKFGDKDLDSESDSSSSESEDDDARVSFRLFVWFPHANSFYSPVKTLRLNIRVSANMLIFTKNRDYSGGRLVGADPGFFKERGLVSWGCVIKGICSQNVAI